MSPERDAGGELTRPRLVLATANQHKLAELTRILEAGRVEVELAGEGPVLDRSRPQGKASALAAAEAAKWRAVAAKLPGHGINDPGFLQPARPMSAIGG